MLESARGSAHSFASALAGEQVSGNWWAHPKAHDIYQATRVVRDSEEILVCRLFDGKVTYVHRDLWPALTRLAPRFVPRQLARIYEVHTASGAHRVDTEPFPLWVTPNVEVAAERLSDREAIAQLSAVVSDLETLLTNQP
jgi:hypothetical protein